MKSSTLVNYKKIITNKFLKSCFECETASQLGNFWQANSLIE